MVAFLKKPNESIGFTEVVDFLKDATGIHNLSNAEIYAGLTTLGYVTKGDIVSLLPAMLAGAVVDQGNTSGSVEDSVQLKELMVLVPKLVNRIGSLEKELKETKQTLGNASVEPEDQGRKFQDIDDDPLVSLIRESMKEKSSDFVTPTKASGEAQEEEISPTILEAAKTLSKVASQSVSKAKSTDKGQEIQEESK
ncbi:hypothetical protein Tco_0850352, partial [Tanacetum coccineum]